MFNRFKLGRSLDECNSYGCDLMFSELPLAVCVQEGIEQRFNHLDTTSFFLTGDYVPDSDEHASAITLATRQADAIRGHGDQKVYRLSSTSYAV